ncbi:MAG: N-formylglutamate amidohydrolase [Sphingobium sp.]
MSAEQDQALLRAVDPPPVRVTNPGGRSSFLLLGDHAGNAVPAALGALGLSAAELERHIGWDIGVGPLGRMLAERLDAPFVEQHYSRLVIDCNRAPDREDAMAAASDGTAVPGNAARDAAARRVRVEAIHAPYHAAIAERLAARDAAGRATVLVALHSFTPVMAGTARPWDIGILHDGGEAGFAVALLARLRGRGDLRVGDNQPYRMDETDYTLPRHAYAARRPYAELEIRQDHLAGAAGQARWADILAEALTAAQG